MGRQVDTRGACMVVMGDGRHAWPVDRHHGCTGGSHGNRWIFGKNLSGSEPGDDSGSPAVFRSHRLRKTAVGGVDPEAM